MKISIKDSVPELTLIQRYKEQLPLRGSDQLDKVSSGASTRFFDNRLAFSVSEVAFLIGVSTRTVNRMLKRGDLKSKRIGKRVLIPKDELGAWLNRKE